MKKILYTLATLVSTGVTLPSVAQSQATTPEPITIRPVIGFSTLSQAINTLMSVAMFGGALICLGYLILGAYKYLTAQDNAANTAAARQTMINAIIGLILLGLIYVIFMVVVNLIPGLNNWFAGSGGDYTCTSSIDPGCAQN